MAPPVGDSCVNWCLAQLFSHPDAGGDEGAWTGQRRRLAVVLKTRWFFPPAGAMSPPPAYTRGDAPRNAKSRYVVWGVYVSCMTVSASVCGWAANNF